MTVAQSIVRRSLATEPYQPSWNADPTAPGASWSLIIAWKASNAGPPRLGLNCARKRRELLKDYLPAEATKEVASGTRRKPLMRFVQ